MKLEQVYLKSTGWTLGKVLLWGDSEAIKLFSMHEHEKYKNKLNNLNDNEKFKLFITGLADAESTFSVNISKHKAFKMGWQVKLVFRIELHEKDAQLLRDMETYFGVGRIYSDIVHKKGKNKTVCYSVESVQDLINVIIPHFVKYPLLTQKAADFILFKQVVELMSHKEHLNMAGLNKIVSLKASINWGLSEVLSKAFPNISPIERPKVEIPKTVDPNWFLGFSEGEGCFYVKVGKSKTHRSGHQVSLVFTLTQHIRERELMKKFIQQFNCGRLEEDSKRSRFVVKKFSDIQEKIIPFFNEYPLRGYKQQDFVDFSKVAKLINDGAHLEKEGLDYILKVKGGMNTGRNYNNNYEDQSDSEPDNPSLHSTQFSNSLAKPQILLTEHRPKLDNKDKNGVIQRPNGVSSVRGLKSKAITREEWYQWLVGFTESEGCFSVVKSGGTYRLQYSLSQSAYNFRILYYVKKNLGYGSVFKSLKQSWGNFRITDRKVLNQVIFPIFDKYPLLTSKYFNYRRFKKAYDILENKNLTTAIKNKMIEELLRVEKLPEDYVSPAISHLNEKSSYEKIASVISVYWLAGFIEAEGYFGVIPDRGRFNIEFTLVQKLDKILLILIKRILHISSNVNYKKTNNIYVLSTKNSRSIENIIDIFRGKFKGMKSLEFKLWSKANYYKKTRIDKVSKISNIISKVRGKNKN